MALLSVTLLGGFKAEYAGQPLGSSRSSKVHALLIYLLVEDAYVDEAVQHRREALMALLWPEMERRAAQNNLRQTAYYLRQALAEAAADSVPVVLSDRETISINADATYELDTVAFAEKLNEVGKHAHKDRSRCRVCLRVLEEAVALYAGDFLADFKLPDSLPFEEWVLVRQERLRRQALAAMETLADAYLGQGQYDRAQALAHRQLEIDSLREPAHRQLMEALARSGNRAAALRQYEVCVQILDEELAIEPAPSIQQLHRAIVDGELAPDKLAFDLRLGDSSGRRALPGSLHNLPRHPSPFIGRHRELAEVCERLGNPHCRLLSIVGLGGIGKTRLAVAAAERLTATFQDGVFYISLAGLVAAEDLASTIGDVVGMPAGTRPAQEELLHYLQDKQVLLLLDNYEHLLPEVSLLELILERCPGAKVLVTSRSRLRLRWEWLYDLEGMRVEQEAGEAFTDAADLFVYHAQRMRADFEPDERTLATIVDICAAVEGVPLAIELAGTSVRHEAVADIAERLRRNVTALSSEILGVPQRHRSMAAAFDYSWELLSGEGQATFARLSVFRDGFTAEAAEAVTEAGKEVVRALLDNSLLRYRGENGYAMHELLRHYAAQKLAEMDCEPKATTERHMLYFAERLVSAAPGTPSARTWISENLDNVRQAWDTAVRRTALSVLSEMVGPLAIFYYGSRRLHEEAKRRFAAAVAGVKERDDASKANVRSILGKLTAWLAYFTVEDEKALRLADEAVELLRPIGAKPDLALALSLRGYAAFAVRDVAGALETLQESRAIYQELGDMLGLTGSLNALTEVYSFLGEYEAAEQYGEECRIISDQIGLDKMSSMVRTHLSKVVRSQGDCGRAEALANEALALAEEIGSFKHKIISLVRLVEVALDDGRYEEAERRLSTVLEMPDLAWEQPVYHAHALSLYGRLCWSQERFDEAKEYLTRALASARDAKAIAVMSRILMVAAIHIQEDRPAQAVELLALLSEHKWSDAEIKSEAKMALDRFAGSTRDDRIEISARWGRGIEIVEVAEEVRLLLHAEPSA